MRDGRERGTISQAKVASGVRLRLHVVVKIALMPLAKAESVQAASDFEFMHPHGLSAVPRACKCNDVVILQSRLPLWPRLRVLKAAKPLLSDERPTGQ